MLIFKNPISILTRDDKPNENWTDENDTFVVEDGSLLGNKILENIPYFEFVLDGYGNLIDIIPTEKPLISLEDYKQNKIIELNVACNKFILSGFESSCTSIKYKYKFDEEYQRNFALTIGAVSVSPEISNIPWPTIGTGIVNHTRQQFIQLYLDGKLFMETNLYRYFGMKAQIEMCGSVEQINLFSW